MVWLPHWPRIGEVVIKNGLERISRLLNVLGDPQKHMPPVIHFAGTNGKGSTIAFVRAILEAAGLKVHIYTSPHLLRYNERIKLCGNEISDGNLYSILEECRVASEVHDIDVSFFEGTTAAAFLAFSRQSADIVLLETGLGGRLDATNVISEPLLSVITPISFDHMHILGNDLKKIAYEKAHIIKKGVPCVVSLQRPEVHSVIQGYAESMDSSLFRYEYEFGCEIIEGGFFYKSHSHLLKMQNPSLSGYHQFINASTAIAAVQHLSGIKITSRNIENGINNAVWPGRLQRITSGVLLNKLPPQYQCWVDGAHNDGGAQSLSAWLRDQDSDYKNIIILGMTRNRDIVSFIKYFQDVADCIIGVPVYSEPMSYTADVIKNAVCGAGFRGFSSKDISDAFYEVVKKHYDKKIRVIITGSLFLVSDFFVANKG